MMIVRILLCLLCFIIIKVSDSQQINIPVQAYPIYQQIPYGKAQQNVPVLIQTSNSNNHYLQANTAQSIVPHDLAKTVISKILSSPLVHKYLDPNTRHCRQSDVELPKHGCSAGSIPHVTNNYFIVPPEYLKLNKSEAESENITPTLYKRVENDVIVVPAEINKYTDANNKRIETFLDANSNNVQNSDTKQKKKRRKRPRQCSKSKATHPDSTMKSNVINGEKDITVTNDKRPEESDLASNETLHVNYIKSTNGSPTKKSHANNKRKRTRQRKKIKRIKEDETSVSSQINKANENSSNIDILAETELNIDVRKRTEELNVKPGTESKPEYVHALLITSSKDAMSCGNVEKCEKSKSKGDDNKVTKNSKDDLIVQEFQQKFPEVPEALVRSMLSYVKSKLQDNFATNFVFPGTVPFNFDHFFHVSQFANQARSSERKKKNKYRRRKQKHQKGTIRKRKNRKNKDKNSKNGELNNELLSTSPVEYEKITEKVTAEIQPLSQIMESPDFSQEFPEETLVITEASVEVIKDLTDYKHNEKETELFNTEVSLEEVDVQYNIDEPYTAEIYQERDLVPTVYGNRLIDDYYPIFTDNAETFDTDEYHTKSLNDRYYYTTDKKKDSELYEDINRPYIYEEIPKPRRTFKDDIPKLLNYNFKDNSLKHTYFDADKEGFKSLARELPKQLPLLKPKNETPKTNYIEETGFKSPPGLEFPDFITRKVEKPSKLQEYRQDSFEESKFDDLAAGQPVYQSFELFSNELKPNGGNKKTKSQEKPKKIETVYAKSKVVNYGADREQETNDRFANEDDGQFNNDRISYVVAKSLVNSDEEW